MTPTAKELILDEKFIIRRLREQSKAITHYTFTGRIDQLKAAVIQYEYFCDLLKNIK